MRLVKGLITENHRLVIVYPATDAVVLQIRSTATSSTATEVYLTRREARAIAHDLTQAAKGLPFATPTPE